MRPVSPSTSANNNGSDMAYRARVFFLTTWYPRTEQPLRDQFIRAHALAASAYADVVVVHLTGPDAGLTTFSSLSREQDESISLGIPTYRLSYRPSCVPKLTFVNTVRAAEFAFKQLNREDRPFDLIHAQIYDAGVLGALLSRRHRLPLAITEHGPELMLREVSRTESLKARFAFGQADLVLPVSQNMAETLRRYVRGRTEILPNVVDPTVFFPPEVPPRSSVQRLLFVGRLHEVKALPVLLDAVAHLPTDLKWQLTIIGDGPMMQWARNEVFELGLADKVIFAGMRPREEVAEQMRSSDVLLLTSRWENAPCVVTEAFACGLPVVATDVGGTGEFVQEGAGLLVPPGKPDEVARAVVRLLTNAPTLDRHQLSEQVLAVHSPQVVGRRLARLYNELRGRTRSRGRAWR